MEKLRYWAIGIASAWALLAFIAWHYESTCGMFLSGACFSELLEWARWIILLKWVHPFQTLIAGLAAVAGGAFVVHAGREQINYLEHAKKDERLERALDSFTTVGMVYSEYFRVMKTARRAPSPIMAPSPELLRDINFISPDLGIHLAHFATYSTMFYEKSKEDLSFFEKSKPAMIAQSLCLFQIFKQISHYALDKDSFVPRISLKKFTFDSASVQEAAIHHKFTDEDLGPYRHFFSTVASSID